MINVECFSFNTASNFYSYHNYVAGIYLLTRKEKCLKDQRCWQCYPFRYGLLHPPPPPISFPAPRNLIKSGGLDINCNGSELTCINPCIARLGSSISCLELLLPVLTYKESPSNSLQSVPHSISECMWCRVPSICSFMSSPTPLFCRRCCRSPTSVNLSSSKHVPDLISHEGNWLLTSEWKALIFFHQTVDKCPEWRAPCFHCMLRSFVVY